MDQQASDRVCPACRLARISQYNPDPLCGPCMVAARQAQGVTPVWIWDSAPLRQALARADMAAVLAILRGASGLSQLDFGTLLGWSQSVVTKIERRKRGTLHDIREVLRVCDVLDIPRKALLPLIFGDPDATLEDDNDVFDPGALMDLTRREASGSLLGLAVAGGLGGFPGLAAPERVDMGHVRYIEASVQRLYAHDQKVGGGMLFQAALRQLARVRLMLDESDYSDQVRQRLITAAGELAAATGWLCYDAGPQYWEMAHTLYGEALMYARLADDDHLMVLVFDDMAMHACGVARRRPGRARHALQLMSTAKDIARPWATPRVLTLLDIRTMRAHAILGDEVGHRQALTRVRREFDKGTCSNDPDWVDFIDATEIRALEALSDLDLGRPERAAIELRQVLQVSELPARNRAYYSARLTSTLAEAGDVTGACEAGVATLPLLTGVGSGRTLTELRNVRRTVAGQKAATEFCDALDAIAT